MTSGDEDRKEPTSELSGSWTRVVSEFKAREALLVKRLTDAWDNMSPILSIPAGGEWDKGLSETGGLGIDDYLELRQVGYYGAIRELQRLVAATCTTTLWVIATNEMAFQFLKPAVGLDQTFSHRIYAGTATRDDLRDAIMLRHN